jgi:hypothetical protein
MCPEQHLLHILRMVVDVAQQTGTTCRLSISAVKNPGSDCIGSVPTNVIASLSSSECFRVEMMASMSEFSDVQHFNVL